MIPKGAFSSAVVKYNDRGKQGGKSNDDQAEQARSLIHLGERGQVKNPVKEQPLPR